MPGSPPWLSPSQKPCQAFHANLKNNIYIFVTNAYKVYSVYSFHSRIGIKTLNRYYLAIQQSVRATYRAYVWVAGIGGDWSVRIGIAVGQGSFEGCIVAIDIIEEAHLAILFYAGCAVENHHTNRVRQVHLLGFGAIHGRQDLLGAPRSAVQHPFGESCQVLQADASVPVIAGGSSVKSALWC